MASIKIPAVYYRGGTSKGIIFKKDDLPEAARQAGAVLDRLLMRVLGSPDPYGKQMDGLGNGSSSTSKALLIGKSSRAGHDVDYLFAQIAIDRPFVDWSGSCGNMIAAVGGFAVSQGLVDNVPDNGVCTVRIWQENTAKTIIAHVPVRNGEVVEYGDFVLDGIAFPAAEVKIEFCEDGITALFPTGQVRDELDIPDWGSLPATLVNAGIAAVLVNAADVGCRGTEMQDEINNDSAKLALLERIRAYGAVKMGIIDAPEQASGSQHVPKIVMLAPPQDYTASGGGQVAAADLDLNVRALSMGKLHHAMMGTASVAVAAAAAVEGTLAAEVCGGARETVCFGHPSGKLKVGAAVVCRDGAWYMERAVMSRSARVIMEGAVRVPADIANSL